MEKIAFETSVDIYNQYDFTTEGEFMNNRLFATFTQLDAIENLIDDLSSSYDIMYNKMFVLFVKSTNEYVVTYNVDQGNIICDNIFVCTFNKKYKHFIIHYIVGRR